MQLLNATSPEQLEKIHALYEKAFPASEKKPFEFILQKRETGSFEILEIADETGIFCGLAIMMLYQNLVLLDYFAVAPECRGTGVGSAAMKALQERYAGGKFMLEIESTVGLENGDMNSGDGNGTPKMSPQVQGLPVAERKARLRRKAFYLRNSMRPMNFCVDLFGVEMEILVHGKSVTFEEYYSVLKSTVPANLIQYVRLL